jgi:hypothetical protein
MVAQLTERVQIKVPTSAVASGLDGSAGSEDTAGVGSLTVDGTAVFAGDPAVAAGLLAGASVTAADAAGAGVPDSAVSLDGAGEIVDMIPLLSEEDTIMLAAGLVSGVLDAAEARSPGAPPPRNQAAARTIITTAVMRKAFFLLFIAAPP